MVSAQCSARDEARVQAAQPQQAVHTRLLDNLFVCRLFHHRKKAHRETKELHERMPTPERKNEAVQRKITITKTTNEAAIWDSPTLMPRVVL